MTLSALAIASDGVRGEPLAIALEGLVIEAAQAVAAIAAVGGGSGSGDWFIAYPKPNRSASATAFAPRVSVVPASALATGARSASASAPLPTATTLAATARAIVVEQVPLFADAWRETYPSQIRRVAEPFFARTTPPLPLPLPALAVADTPSVFRTRAIAAPRARARAPVNAPITRATSPVAATRAGANVITGVPAIQCLAPDAFALGSAAVDVTDTHHVVLAIATVRATGTEAPAPERLALHRVRHYVVSRARAQPILVVRAPVAKQKVARPRVTIPRTGRK